MEKKKTTKTGAFLSKNKNKIIAGVVLAVLLYIIWKLYSKNKEARLLTKTTEEEVKTNGNNIINTGTSKPDSEAFNGDRLLQRGLTSKEVLLAQRRMNELAGLLNRAFPIGTGTASGAMGGTYSSVAQTNYGVSGFDFELLVEDGIFGSKTESYFNNLLKKNKGTYNEVKSRVEYEKKKVYSLRPELKGQGLTTEQQSAINQSVMQAVLPWWASPLSYFF